DATQQLRHPEGGAIGHHGEVAHERHDEAPALTGAVDRDEHDLRAALELHERHQVDAVGLAVERLAALVLPPHLAAHAEVVAGAGEYDDVDVGIALGEHGRLLDAVIHLDGAGVAPLGPVDHDAQDPTGLRAAEVAGVEIDGLVLVHRHAFLLPAQRARAPAARGVSAPVRGRPRARSTR